MAKEIGSEFWLAKISKKYIKDSPYWINEWGNNVLTTSGRGAISLMLKQVENKVLSKTVLIPAYTCESIITPFIREGYTCYFYDIDNNIEPSNESLETFCGERIGIFLHMGYFGFPTNKNLHNYINQLKRKGTIIVEDLTHTIFSKYKRCTENDYYIASLRKWTGLPSGGFLASRVSDIQGCLDAETSFSNIREEALMIKGEYIKSNNRELKQRYLHMFEEAEFILDNDLKPYSIDRISNTIINELDINELIEKRKKNFMFLLNALKGIEGVKPIFNEIPDAICPLFFPVYIDKGREKFKKLLIDENIYCPIHWPIPPQIDIFKYPLSKKVYSCILSIPCDQRYDIKDMERIANVINKISTEKHKNKR
jgi:hypothetical protein